MKKPIPIRALLSAFLAGILFPLIGTAAVCFNLPIITFASISKYHINNPLFWLLDLVPIAFIGYAYIQSLLNRKLYDAVALPRSMFIDAGIAIIAFDQAGIVIAFNPAAERLLGYNAMDIIGSASYHLFHSPHELTDRIHTIREKLQVSGSDFDVMVAATHNEHCDYKIWSIIHSNGTRTPVEISVSPLSDDHGNTIGYLETVYDISMWKEGDSRLVGEWRRNKSALEIAGLGVWELDLINDHIEYSDNLGPIYGLSYGKFYDNYDEYVNHIHPDDRKYLDEMENRLFIHGISEGLKYRIFYPDGSIHVISIREHVYRNKAGRPIRIIGLASRMS